MTMNHTYAANEPQRAQVDVMAGPTVVEFGAPWCGYCLGAQSLIESALAGYPDVRHLKIEDGRGRPLGRSFRIKLWPTLVFLRDGEEVVRLVRPTGAEEMARALASIAPQAT